MFRAVRVCDLDGGEDVFAGDGKGVSLIGANEMMRRVKRVVRRVLV